MQKKYSPIKIAEAVLSFQDVWKEETLQSMHGEKVSLLTEKHELWAQSRKVREVTTESNWLQPHCPQRGTYQRP